MLCSIDNESGEQSPQQNNQELNGVLDADQSQPEIPTRLELQLYTGTVRML